MQNIGACPHGAYKASGAWAKADGDPCSRYTVFYEAGTASWTLADGTAFANVPVSAGLSLGYEVSAVTASTGAYSVGW